QPTACFFFYSTTADDIFPLCQQPQVVPKLRGACLVAASCVSFASARGRKLTRSAAAPLPTKSDDFAGAPVGNTPQAWGKKPFRGERQRKAKWRERMRDNPYKDLPPLERRP